MGYLQDACASGNESRRSHQGEDKPIMILEPTTAPDRARPGLALLVMASGLAGLATGMALVSHWQGEPAPGARSPLLAVVLVCLALLLSGAAPAWASAQLLRRPWLAAALPGVVGNPGPGLLVASADRPCAAGRPRGDAGRPPPAGGGRLQRSRTGPDPGQRRCDRRLHDAAPHRRPLPGPPASARHPLDRTRIARVPAIARHRRSTG